MNGYQVIWNNHPQVDLSKGLTLKGIAKGLTINDHSVAKGAFYVQREGYFRVQTENLAAAEQFAAQELLRQYRDKDWANDVHFTVRGKELSRFEQKAWLELADFMKGQVKELPVGAAYRDELVLAILAVIFSGLGLCFSWTPIMGIIFALVGLILTLLAWLRHNNRTLTVIATVLAPLGLILSIMMTLVWFTFWIYKNGI
ncbi:MAG: hypothetical protein LBI13_04280 [Streptococcaceae bacterium]|jgi:hypothetical protein|nr:hypothetical protein [Streptococcaceae bacterium]